MIGKPAREFIRTNVQIAPDRANHALITWENTYLRDAHVLGSYASEMHARVIMPRVDFEGVCVIIIREYPNAESTALPSRKLRSRSRVPCEQKREYLGTSASISISPSFPRDSPERFPFLTSCNACHVLTQLDARRPRDEARCKKGSKEIEMFRERRQTPSSCSVLRYIGCYRERMHVTL